MPAGYDQIRNVFFILLYCTAGFAFELGVGAGIASFPGTLDPYDLIDEIPVVYPRIELGVPVLQRWQVTCGAQRSVFDANMYGCFCIQSLTLNTLSAGCAVRLGQKGDFALGVDGMYGFCTYDHGGIPINTNNYGMKIHLSAQQPLWRDLSYVLRAGVQQERVVTKDDLPRIDMTIFSVECMVILGL
jgi:hypothetical protein